MITGASSGIGRATAIRLSKTYSLILGGRDKKRLEETRTMCENADLHLLWCYDLADVKGIAESLSTFIKETSSSVCGFIHSAGIGMGVVSSIRMMTLDFMQSVMNVNFFSAVEIMKILVSRKINGKTLNNVVLVSSISSCLGSKGLSIYGASKGALDAFARSAAYELAPHIRVNTVVPGDVIKASVMGNQYTPAEEEVLSTCIEKGYILGAGTVWDIAEMIAFLISDKSHWITGQSFVVDGGKKSHF